MSVDATQMFDISLSKPLCIQGLSEDSIREFVNALQVVVKDPNFGGFVTATGDVQVTFSFGPDGNFAGAFALLNGMQIPIILGVNSKALYMFAGAPSSTSPGPGFTVDVELTKELLNQT